MFLAIVAFTFNCNAQLDKLIDDWHLAATEANYEAYFGPMDETFVFLGTAPGERWEKEAFSAFSKPYFDKGQAWDFKASNRIWMFSKNKKTKKYSFLRQHFFAKKGLVKVISLIPTTKGKLQKTRKGMRVLSK